MKKALVMVLGCLFTAPLFARTLLPGPDNSLPGPTESVKERQISHNDKDLIIYKKTLAQNTLPEPEVYGKAIFSDSIMASTHQLAPPINTKTPFKNSIDFYVTGGPGFTDFATNGTIKSAFISGTTTYSANSSSTNGVYSVASAYTFHRVHKKPIDLSLGLAFMGTSSAKVSGTSTVDNVVNLPYSYQICSKALFFEQRATYLPKKYPLWQPYLITGFGPSWNNLSDFSGDNGQLIPGMGNFSRIPTDASQNFSNNTEDSFAYEVGFGVQHPFTSHLALTADYRYINFGEGSLGGIPAYPAVTNRLSTPSLGENTVLLSLKAFFAT